MKNKVVWITGASSGIGEALVYAYHQMGAKLIISSRNRDELFRVKSNCKNAVNIHVLSLDLEDLTALPRKAGEAQKIFGQIDLLIHSAGVGQRSGALETGMAVEQKIMTVNYWGAVVLSKEILPGMITAGGGKIVCISSLTGKSGQKSHPAYAASKQALQGYFEALRNELTGRNIIITLVYPGGVKTNFSIHALNAQGIADGEIDPAQPEGILPEACAALIVKGIEEHKEEIVIGEKENQSILFRRFFQRNLRGK